MNVITPWFPPTTKPVRDGEYLTRIDRWDEFPTPMRWSVDRWIGIRHSPIGNQNLEWRGLAFDPAAAVECEGGGMRWWWVSQP